MGRQRRTWEVTVNLSRLAVILNLIACHFRQGPLWGGPIPACRGLDL